MHLCPHGLTTINNSVVYLSSCRLLELGSILGNTVIYSILHKPVQRYGVFEMPASCACIKTMLSLIRK